MVTFDTSRRVLLFRDLADEVSTTCVSRWDKEAP